MAHETGKRERNTDQSPNLDEGLVGGGTDGSIPLTRTVTYMHVRAGRASVCDPPAADPAVRLGSRLVFQELLLCLTKRDPPMLYRCRDKKCDPGSILGRQLERGYGVRFEPISRLVPCHIE